MGRGNGNRDNNKVKVNSALEWRNGGAMSGRGEEMADNWYIFFVKTGQEAVAIQDISTYFNGKVTPREFRIETFFRRKGIIKREEKNVFPGYVFVETSLNNEEFVLQCRNFFSHTSAILRLLFYGDTRQAALHENEKKLLEQLWTDQNCLEASVGIVEGDRVRIIAGPFVGKESMIRRVNRHKMQAVIELDLMGETRQITVGLNVIQKE